MKVADQCIRQLGQTLKLRSQIGDELLAVAYLQFQQDKLLPVVFHNQPDMTLRGFLDWHSQPTMEYLGCFTESATGDVQLRGMGWINQSRRFGEEAIAEVGLGFFRKTHPRIAAEFTEMLIDHCFQVRDYKAIYGISPIQNQTIHRFAVRLGFTSHGPLPYFCGWNGQATSAYLYHMTQYQWIFGRTA